MTEHKIRLDLKQQLKKKVTAGGTYDQSIRILGRELVKSQKIRDQLQTSITQLSSVSMQLSEQSAMLRMTGHFQRSTEITKGISSCMTSLPELQRRMEGMQREMMHAGLIDEMMTEGFESAMESSSAIEDEQIDAAIDSVLAGVNRVSPSPVPIASPLPISPVHEPARSEEEDQAEEERLQQFMQQRLNALR